MLGPGPSKIRGGTEGIADAGSDVSVIRFSSKAVGDGQTVGRAKVGGGSAP
jgi:hypothetical protein|tara:strand:+ start:1395 stop:1547 length:153 start_codon:yes stop_codon:yes gene_type:complete